MFGERLRHYQIRYRYTGQPDMLILFALYFVKFVTGNGIFHSIDAEESTVYAWAEHLDCTMQELIHELYGCYFQSCYRVQADPTAKLVPFIKEHPGALGELTILVEELEYEKVEN